MKTTVLLGSLAMLFLTGCDPKRFDIVVPTSAIDQARQGGVGYAKAKLEYTFFDDDVKSKLSQIKSVVLKYCKDGEADWSEDDFQTVFRVRGKIPVGDEGAIADEKCPIALVVSGKRVELKTTRYLSMLNSELENVNSQVKAEFKGCRLNLNILRNTSSEFKIEVFGVFVDEKPYAHGEIKFDHGDQKTIAFARSDDTVYHDRNPFFNILSDIDCLGDTQLFKSSSGTQQFAATEKQLDAIYVDALMEVNEPRDGSEARPFATIQSAVDAAKSRQRIIVSPGEYNESVTIKSKQVFLISKDGPGTTTIKAEKLKAAIMIEKSAEGSEVSGFAITGGTGGKKENGIGFYYCGGGIMCLARARVRNCIIYHNGYGEPRKTSATLGGGVYCGSGELQLSNCLIFDNFAWAGGGGVHAEGGRIIVEHCTIAHNEANEYQGCYGGVGLSKKGYVNVRYSIIWGNSGDQIGALSRENDGTELRVDYSDVQGGVSQNNVQKFDEGRGCFSRFPNFVDAVNSDYELKEGSPCLTVDSDEGDVEIGFSKKRIRN